MKNPLYYILFLILFSVISSSCVSQKQDKNKSIYYEKQSSQLIESTTDTSEQDLYKLHKALDFINKSIEHDSLNINAYNLKTTILLRLGKYNDAILTLNKLLRIKKSFAEGYTLLGLTYEKIKSMDSANIAFNKAKEIYLTKPSNDLRNFNLITLEYLITKNKSEALKKLEEYNITNDELKKSLELELEELEKNRL